MRAPSTHPEIDLLKILVVDDYQDAADALTALFCVDGHDAKTAYGGQAAVDLLEVFSPDVIFLAIGMLGMDGNQTARIIRARKQSAGIRMVAISGRGKASDLRNSVMAGFDHHMIKPVAYDELTRYLNEVKPVKPA